MGDRWAGTEFERRLAGARSDATRPAFVFSPQTEDGLALAATLRRHGLEPAAVAGVGLGELTAAVAAGRLDLGDASRVARTVSMLLAASAGGGRTAAVATNRTSLARMLGARGPTLALTLAPRMQVIAGRAEDVERACDALRAADVEVHELDLPTTFHSGVVEALREPFLRQLESLAPHPGHARLYSGIDPSPQPSLDAAHWWDVCCRPFHFDDAIRAMLANRIRWFIEVGPRSAVTGYILAIAVELRLSVRVDSAHELLPTHERRSAEEPRPDAAPPRLRASGSSI